jgi:hypothetical protein
MDKQQAHHLPSQAAEQHLIPIWKLDYKFGGVTQNRRSLRLQTKSSGQ